MTAVTPISQRTGRILLEASGDCHVARVWRPPSKSGTFITQSYLPHARCHPQGFFAKCLALKLFEPLPLPQTSHSPPHTVAAVVYSFTAGMVPVAGTSLFDLVHLPETIEKLVFPSVGAHEQGRREHRHHGHRRNEKKAMGAVPVDILETPKAYTFFLDVPGLSKSDIQVTVEDESMLVIKSSGKRKREEGEEEGCKYLRLERKAACPKFLRRFQLADDSDAAKITARCENGELRVTVEKRPPPQAPKAKTVEVSIA